jgi:hypothetical protein
MEVGRRMNRHLPTDPAVTNALVGWDTEKLEEFPPQVLIANLAQLVVGQALAIKFLGEQIHELRTGEVIPSGPLQGRDPITDPRPRRGRGEPEAEGPIEEG